MMLLPKKRRLVARWPNAISTKMFSLALFTLKENEVCRWYKTLSLLPSYPHIQIITRSLNFI